MISEKSSTIKTALRAVGPLIPPAPYSPSQSPGGEGVPSGFWVVLYQRILASISGLVFMHADPISGPPAPYSPSQSPGVEGGPSGFWVVFFYEY